MNFSKNATFLQSVKSLKSGDLVKAYLFEDGIAERVFWELDGDTAYISSHACYERMLRGDPEARPTGFLVSDLVLENE